MRKEKKRGGEGEEGGRGERVILVIRPYLGFYKADHYHILQGEGAGQGEGGGGRYNGGKSRNLSLKT